MKDLNTLKRGDVVTLLVDRTPMEGDEFKAGDRFKFLNRTGYGVSLSRIGDCAKLGVVAADIGYADLSLVAPVTKPAPAAPTKDLSRFDAPHSDESGPSRFVVTHTVLAGKESRTSGIHLTPSEEREYNAGAALLVELFG